MAKRFDPKAKARKQKILAAGLGVVLVGVLVFQAPTILGMFKGSSSTPSTTPAPAPVPTPAAPPATPGATPAPAPAPDSTSQLVDSDVAPEASDGQLVSFDRFQSKDPFIQQVGGGEAAEPSGAAETPPSPSGNEGLARGDEGQQGPTLRETTPQPSESGQTRTAKISVNGAAEDVAVSGTFPESDPMFKLVSISRNSVKVGIVDGAYATGAPTITLKKAGKPVTLMNTADGTTYVLRLVSLS
jgi:hypothetical protein